LAFFKLYYNLKKALSLFTIQNKRTNAAGIPIPPAAVPVVCGAAVAAFCAVNPSSMRRTDAAPVVNVLDFISHLLHAGSIKRWEAAQWIRIF